MENVEALKRLLSKYDFNMFVSFVGYWSNIGLNFDGVDKDQIIEAILTASRMMMEILDEREKE